MEESNDTKYIDENPELKLWWEEHKKEDERRLKLEQEDINAARLAIEAAIDYTTTYKEMLMNPGLSHSDKSYFTDKITRLKTEISEIFRRFPDIARDYS